MLESDIYKLTSEALENVGSRRQFYGDVRIIYQIISPILIILGIVGNIMGIYVANHSLNFPPSLMPSKWLGYSNLRKPSSPTSKVGEATFVISFASGEEYKTNNKNHDDQNNLELGKAQHNVGLDGIFSSSTESPQKTVEESFKKIYSTPGNQISNKKLFVKRLLLEFHKIKLEFHKILCVTRHEQGAKNVNEFTKKVANGSVSQNSGPNSKIVFQKTLNLTVPETTANGQNWQNSQTRRKRSKKIVINSILFRIFFYSNLVYTLSLVLCPFLEVVHSDPDFSVTSNNLATWKNIMAFFLNHSNLNPKQIFHNNLFALPDDESSASYLDRNDGDTANQSIALEIYEYRFQKSDHWWEQYAYTLIAARFVNPIFKCFIAWSFLIYLFISFNQLMAIRSPVRYRLWLSVWKLRVILAFGFVYCFAWYAPTAFWMQPITKARIFRDRLPHLILSTGFTSSQMTVTQAMRYVANCRDHVICPRNPFGYKEFFVKSCRNSRPTSGNNYTERLGECNTSSINLEESGDAFEKKLGFSVKSVLNYLLYTVELYDDYKFYTPPKAFYRIWSRYQLLRELLVKILPFLAILIVKFMYLRTKKNVDSTFMIKKPLSLEARPGARIESQTNKRRMFNNKIATVLPNSKEPKIAGISDISTLNYLKEPVNNLKTKSWPSPIVSQRRDSHVIKIERSLTISDLNVGTDKIPSPLTRPPGSSICSNNLLYSASVTMDEKRRHDRKVSEYNQLVKSLVILTIEFFVFIFPLSFVQMTLDQLVGFVAPNTMTNIIAVLLMLEYCYTSLSFYLIYLSNQTYRTYTNNILSNLVEKWKNPPFTIISRRKANN